jgi:hypothetical protein
MNTTKSHSRFYVLLKLLPYSKKEDMVWQYSGMATDSLSEFYARNPQGYSRMIAEMQQLVNKMEIPSTPNQSSIKMLRSAILHRLQKHGVDTTNWDKVNRFMENPRIAGKRLYNMSEAEMRAFIPKMQSILAKDKVNEEQIERLASMN